MVRLTIHFVNRCLLYCWVTWLFWDYQTFVIATRPAYKDLLENWQSIFDLKLSNINLSCSLDTKVHISKGTTKKSTHKETNLDKYILMCLRYIRWNFSATADDVHDSACFLWSPYSIIQKKIEFIKSIKISTDQKSELEWLLCIIALLKLCKDNLIFLRFFFFGKTISKIESTPVRTMV